MALGSSLGDIEQDYMGQVCDDETLSRLHNHSRACDGGGNGANSLLSGQKPCEVLNDSCTCVFVSTVSSLSGVIAFTPGCPAGVFLG